MEDYSKLVRDLIEDHIKESIDWDLRIGKNTSRREILEDLRQDTHNVFGNEDGSRTFSTYEAMQFIEKSGAIWDSYIQDLFEEIGDDYFFEQLKRGPEALDVTICELLAPRIISEMLEEEPTTE